MNGIWENFLNIVRQEAGTRIVDTWFRAIVLHHWDALECVIYLKAPNQFICEWVQRNYMALIYVHMSRLLNVEIKKVVIVDEQSSSLLPAPAQAVPVPVSKRGTQSLTVHKRSEIKTHINEHYSFDAFVVGPSNSLAYAAAQAVAEKPGSLYNPLFIYGGSGLGKTHLLHAIGNSIKSRNRELVILYQTTDRFVSEFISAIRFDRIHKFQEKYRHVDVLLVDDIQFISNKDQTQEAFFHIFNTLHEARKQIVFSGDVYPHSIEGIADRLRSRLAAGMVADILMPPLETKIAIIKKKAEGQGVVLEDTVAHRIASYQVMSIRELEGSLVRVLAFCALTKQPITQEIIYKVLGAPTVIQPAVKAVGLDTIARAVGKHCAFDLGDLRSDKRTKELSLARHMAMFLMKRVAGKSLRDIGAFLGGRGHATVLHAIDKIEHAMQKDEELRRQITALEKELVHH